MLKLNLVILSIIAIERLGTMLPVVKFYNSEARNLTCLKQHTYFFSILKIC
jgi:hypothetical protein